MTSQKRIHESSEKSGTIKHDQEDTSPAPKAAGERDTTLQDEMDEILDEIDSVLEENAEEFVSQFVQKGGELASGLTLHNGGQWCMIGSWNQTQESVPNVRRRSDLRGDSGLI